MFRAKLLRAIALGLCLSVLNTGAAYAQSGGGSSPSYEGQVEAEDSALFEKQREIDTYLFKEHAEEIEEKGIMVVYTGIADSYVEIGIANYSDENADYLYKLFGKDIVNVVLTEEAEVYTTMVAPDAVVNDLPDATVSSDDAVYTTMDLASDTPLKADAGAEQVLEPRAEDSMAATSEIVTSEAGTEEASGELENPEVIYQTTVADAAVDGKEVQVVSAPLENADDTDKDASGLSAPMAILLIAGGAAVIGTAVIVSGKKRAEK